MKKSEGNSKEACCPICMENPLDTSLNSCVHRFCYPCINKWTSRKQNCPVCRRTVRKITHGNLTKVVKRRRAANITVNVSRPVQRTQLVHFVQIPMMPLNFSVQPNYFFGYYYMPMGIPQNFQPMLMPPGSQ